MPDNGRIKWNPSISLMKNRMWGYTPREEYDTTAQPASLNSTSNIATEGLEQQSRLLQDGGGYNQQDRMIFDKSRTLDRALVYSYQGANIQKVSSDTTTENPICRALINPNKLKQDYDDKILSVHKEENFKPGDVFKWLNTDTYWLIYLQDLTELAYFRGDIRKCSYQIDWLDEDGTQYTTYAAIRGPVETKIDYIQKHKISVDNPNYSLNILLPKNKDTLNYFKRYSKFYLQNEEIQSSNVCWRVEAIDWLSMEGILEINATEYYANESEDDIDKGLVGSLIIKDTTTEEDPTEVIVGEKLIKPKKEYTYTFIGVKMDDDWKLTSRVPVKLTVDSEDRRKVHIKWTSSYSGAFELAVGDYKKSIIVESLF